MSLRTYYACEICGKEFFLTPAFAKNPGSGRFCSMACKSENIKPLEERFWEKVEKGEDCWIWTASRDKDGYGGIREGKKGSAFVKAHRVSWEIHNGPIPDGLIVLHKCDNPPCVNPDHLTIGTHKENYHDSETKGRRNNVAPKLTSSEAMEIRERYAKGGIDQKQLGREYGVTQSMVHLIVSGKKWKQVT